MNFDTDPVEISPVKPVQFHFDTTVSDAPAKEISANLDKLRERISRIASEATLCDQPVIMSLLQHFPEADPKELATLGKALERIAKILPEYRKLKERHEFISIARRDPDWVAGIFGSFENQLDAFLSDVTKTD